MKRTQDIHERGARITVVRAASGSTALRGYMKIGPAPKLTRNKQSGRFQDADGRYDYEGYYLNDIMVAPDTASDKALATQPQWRHGLGTALLHAGFVLQECNPDVPLVLDAFKISTRVNGWYIRMGLLPDPDIPTGEMRLGNTLLEQVYYSTPALRGVRQYLETKLPGLRYYHLR